MDSPASTLCVPEEFFSHPIHQDCRSGGCEASLDPINPDGRETAVSKALIQERPADSIESFFGVQFVYNVPRDEFLIGET